MAFFDGKGDIINSVKISIAGLEILFQVFYFSPLSFCVDTTKVVSPADMLKLYVRCTALL